MQDMLAELNQKEGDLHLKRKLDEMEDMCDEVSDIPGLVVGIVTALGLERQQYASISFNYWHSHQSQYFL